ncbi:hypothetical protein [Psychromonas antarctica]|uniref:hypothetical protein n=1 Tax=Psychromonas antarctica TaxID=67573 RepID=UPI001EE97966|nr:hypothetical protein [Psychromonas antarctica]MCG6202021.1 hypothetical protein [Psychromonas antarctica]
MKNIQHYPIFTDENLYPNQINWIVKQIESCKDDSFSDIEQARSEIGKITTLQLGKNQPKRQLQRNLKLAESHLHGFRNSFLSESGFSKLNTTLKVARKRFLDKEAGSKKLDVTVSPAVFEKLNEIVMDTGLTKTALIEELILNYNDRLNSEYEEEQLELDVPDPDVKWKVYTRFSQIQTGTLMRFISSKIAYTVADFDEKTILFDNDTELDAYQAKKKYEFSNG